MSWKAFQHQHSSFPAVSATSAEALESTKSVEPSFASSSAAAAANSDPSSSAIAQNDKPAITGASSSSETAPKLTSEPLSESSKPRDDSSGPHSETSSQHPADTLKPQDAQTLVGSQSGDVYEGQSSSSVFFRPLATEPTPPTSDRVPISILPEDDPSNVFNIGRCLDGSPPAYHLSPGRGAGSRKWVLFLEQGGWCTTVEECRQRTETALGSSRRMEAEVAFGGVLSGVPGENPYFFDWNRVLLRYCDGASFSGDAGQVSGLHLQGVYVLKRVLAHLANRMGLNEASHVLLAGCSSGGLGALLRCDHTAAMLQDPALHFAEDGVGPADIPGDTDKPQVGIGGTLDGQQGAAAAAAAAAAAGGSGSLGGKRRVVVKCLSDGGFFPEMEDFFGNETMKGMFQALVALHNPVLDHECKAGLQRKGRGHPASCYFPEHFLKHSTVPFYLLNSEYDLWVIRNGLLPASGDKGKYQEWAPCRESLAQCTAPQLSLLQNHRIQLIGRVKQATRSWVYRSNSAFLVSCRTHCQALASNRWFDRGAPRVDGVTYAEAVGRWFYEEQGDKDHIDCSYPCNPSCSPNALDF